MPNRPYDSRTWRTLRKRILYRDNYICQLRINPQCLTRADTVHHIQDWKHGGAWYTDSNLQAACHICNTTESNQRNALTNTQPSHTW